MSNENQSIASTLRRAPESVRDQQQAAEAARRLVARAAENGLADVVYAPVSSPFGELLLAAAGWEATAAGSSASAGCSSSRARSRRASDGWPCPLTPRPHG